MGPKRADLDVGVWNGCNRQRLNRAAVAIDGSTVNLDVAAVIRWCCAERDRLVCPPPNGQTFADVVIVVPHQKVQPLHVEHEARAQLPGRTLIGFTGRNFEIIGADTQTNNDPFASHPSFVQLVNQRTGSMQRRGLYIEHASRRRIRPARAGRGR